MAKIERFDYSRVWQKSRKLTSEIYLISNRGKFAKDFGLAKQIQRASVSVISNIAEGYERKSTAEYLRITKASNAELRSRLFVAYDVDYLDKTNFITLKDKAQKILRMVSGFIKATKNQILKGIIMNYNNYATKNSKSKKVLIPPTFSFLFLTLSLAIFTFVGAL